MNSPITGKTMSYTTILSEIHYKGLDISFMKTCWKCIDSGEIFTTTEQDEINMKRIEEEWIKISQLSLDV